MASSSFSKIDRLYQRLVQAGLDIDYVRGVIMPDWWDDSIANSPAGQAEAMGLISRRLNIELSTLRDECAVLVPCGNNSVSFKTHKGVMEDEINWPKSVAFRALQLAIQALDTEAREVPDATAIRESILQKGAQWIGLEELLEFCWNAGIAVLHISNLPKGKKMDGMAARINGKLGIVLSNNRKHSSWLLFILAHELGHIGSGHLDKATVCIDEEVTQGMKEKKEKEANTFALKLIAGAASPRFPMPGKWSATMIKDSAVKISTAKHVNPGTVILNYAWRKNDWAAPIFALNQLEGSGNAISLIRSKMVSRLNWDHLSDDNQEFLLRVTGATLP